MDYSIDKENLPQHVALIMDGNGRWAKAKGKLRVVGHENGAKSLKKVVECSSRIGIKYLTAYSFSTENWNRPKLEVDFLMKIMLRTLKKEFKTFMDNDVRLNAIGDLTRLPDNFRNELYRVMEATKDNKRMMFTLALNYGSRHEMCHAVKQICDKVKNNLISIDSIDDEVINNHLYTNNMPDVDLLIRTSGECRVSNYLLWQIAYAELYFTEKLWPDFKENELIEAISSYQKRERRFGKTSEQVK